MRSPERPRPWTRVVLASRAYGRAVGVDVAANDVTTLRPWLPHWWIDDDVEPERVWTVTPSAGFGLVISELELWVAEHAEDVVFVHAGVVAFDGRALLLPGRSHAGKTTLTAALLRAGAAYGSDEYAVLDRDGRVHPYPRPLALRVGRDRNRVLATELGAPTFVDALPVGGVAVLRYLPGGSTNLASITPGVAVLRLFDCTICAQTRPQAALEALIAATSSANAVEGDRGDAESVVPALRELVA